MFWSDVGKEPKIEGTSLDGNQTMRMTFNFTHLSYPTCLELDRKEKKIYWIERSLEKILFMTYTGLNITVLTAMRSVTFFDMALFRVSNYYDLIS